jgi:hypothetical protein
MNVSGVVVQGMMLGPRMMAEAAAVAPALADHKPGAMEIAGRTLTGFAVGIMLVWIYAMIRPRFGPGPKTAMISAFVVWVFGFLFYLDWLWAGMMSPTLYAIVSVVMIITLAIAAWLGAMLYKEDGAAA